MFKKSKHGPVLLAGLYATYSLRREGLHGPCFGGFGTNAKPLFLSSRGCFPLVGTQAVGGIYLKILPFFILYFCSNVLGSLT